MGVGTNDRDGICFVAPAGPQNYRTPLSRIVI